MLPIIIAGGYMMYPLMILSIVSLAIIFERYQAFRKANVDSSALRNEVIALLKRDQVQRAIQLCATTPGPVSAILLVGLRRYERLRRQGQDSETIDQLVTKAMADYAPHILEVLEARLYLLSVIGTVAPLLGMTGTVTGMISAFNAIAGAAQMEAQLVASGISEALITTAAGLLIAIPAVIVYHIYSRRVDRFVLEIEEAAAKLVDYVTSGVE